MRRLLLPLSLALVLPAAARPDEASDLKDKALKAAAKDPADMAKVRVHTLKAKGVSKLGPEPVPATWEIQAAWPGQMRLTWEFGLGAARNAVTLVASDDRGWRRVAGTPAADLSVEELNDLRAGCYAIWVGTLTTLNDPETKLAAAGTAKVGDTPVVGLKVSRRTYPDVTLYFDESSGLLKKMVYRSREAGVSKTKEIVYDGHKAVGGVMLPTKQTISIEGRETFIWAETEYTLADKLDAKMFDKP